MAEAVRPRRKQRQRAAPAKDKNKLSKTYDDVDVEQPGPPKATREDSQVDSSHEIAGEHRVRGEQQRERTCAGPEAMERTPEPLPKAPEETAKLESAQPILPDAWKAGDVGKVQKLLPTAPPDVSTHVDLAKDSWTDLESEARVPEGRLVGTKCRVPAEAPAPLYPALSQVEGEGAALVEVSEEAADLVEAFPSMDVGASFELGKSTAVLHVAKTAERLRSHRELVAQMSSVTIEKLYPELPREVADERVHASQEKEIEEEKEADAAFSYEQLRMLYPCSWLEGPVAMVTMEEEFSSQARQEGHELHELLLHYLRCRRELLSAQAQLQAMLSEYKALKRRLWIFTEGQATAQGICADKVKVTGKHHFQTVELNAGAFTELQRLLKARSELLYQTLALHTYTSVLSRLQVESYLHHLLRQTPAFRAFTHSVDSPPERRTVKSKCTVSELLQLTRSVSVLFGFKRRSIADAQFNSDVQGWLQQLVAVLLRVGSINEDIFLLNHVLRCPAGVAEWAAPFLQIRMGEGPGIVSRFMKPLAVLMSPVRNRSEFLCQLKALEKPPFPVSAQAAGEKQQLWTFVDEVGEEEENEDSWLLLLENDLVALFCQFPFQELFQKLLGMQDDGTFTVAQSTSGEMMKLLAVAGAVIEVLASGLETFNRVRYRQFVKRIGQTMRLTVSHVSDCWSRFSQQHRDSVASAAALRQYGLGKLQAEFDQLFLRTAAFVMRTKRLGIWQFMSEMPYGRLSMPILWRLYCSLHLSEREGLEPYMHLSVAECKAKLLDKEFCDTFEEYLSGLDESEAIFLLTAFGKMAQAQREDDDEELVSTITLEIYRVAYVSTQTRELCSKVGRELLVVIAGAHPYVVSLLLAQAKDNLDQAALYLFKELPLTWWRPTSEDLILLGNWLVENGLLTVQNKLTCLILEGMNWGLNAQGTGLAVDSSVHLEVALLVMEAYQRFLANKPYGGIISESIKQVSYLASVVRASQSPESIFNAWAWELVLRLKLHHMDWILPGGAGVTTPPPPRAVPDLAADTELHPLRKAVAAGIPLGCYLALSITTLGHSVEEFCAKGVLLLSALVDARCLRATVFTLAKILPRFYSCPFYLLKNQQFLQLVQTFLQVDGGVAQGVTQQVTHKVTQHFSSAPAFGENVRLLNSVIQAHASDSCHPGAVGPAAVLDFWCQLLTSFGGWYREPLGLFLLDQLCKAAFYHRQEEVLHKVFYLLHKTALGYHGDKGIVSSLISWVVSGNPTPSFIEGEANSSEVWFAWTVLNTEAIFEEDSQVRKHVELELQTNPMFSPEQALKKAQSKLKMPVAPSPQRLMVYRWAQQALVTPEDHPVLPLIWQKFLLLYLHRPGQETGMPYGGSVGSRFFQAPAQRALLDRLKKRLAELADYHHGASKAVRAPQTFNVGTTGPPAPPVPPSSSSPARPQQPHTSPSAPSATAAATALELHKELVKLFHLFHCWLDDEKLQGADLYLPSVPLHYDPHRMVRIFNNDQDLWLEFVDMTLIGRDLAGCRNDWLKELQSNGVLTPGSNTAPGELGKSVSRGSPPRPKRPCEPPPLPWLKAPVPAVVASCLCDDRVAEQLVAKDLQVLQQQACQATVRECRQVALDQDLLELLPGLYYNGEDQEVLQLECRPGYTSSSTHSCTGAATVTIKFERAYMNERIKQQLHDTRVEAKQLLAETSQLPHRRVPEAVVHTEELLTALINEYKVQPKVGMRETGVALFYLMVSFVSEETTRYPPSRQFLSSCLEVLGQMFISGVETESERLLQTVLKNSCLCSLLSPHFTPNAAPRAFVGMYGLVAATLSTDTSDTVFMLLTKFDVSQWLSVARPPLPWRGELLAGVCAALCTCGAQPSAEMVASSGLLRSHWRKLLAHHFPDHYGETLRMLVDGSDEQKLSPEVWSDVLLTLGCTEAGPNEAWTAPAATITTATAAAAITIESDRAGLLSDVQVRETMEWLARQLLALRLLRQGRRSFGLYSAWRPYVPAIASLCGFLGRNLLRAERARLVRNGKAGTPDAEAAVQSIYSLLTDLFKPWILYLETGDKSCPRSSPWLDVDSALACTMVHLFCDCVRALHELFGDMLPFGGKGSLWLHWQHYCSTMAQPGIPDHVLAVYHSEFSALPWAHFQPDIQAMQAFFKVECGGQASCFRFLGSALCQVNWLEVLAGAWGPFPSGETCAMLTYLLYTLAALARESSFLDAPDGPLPILMAQAAAFPWQLVDPAAYESVAKYVGEHFQASLVLGAPGDAASRLLPVLKAAAGLTPGTCAGPHPDALPKCRAYVKLLVGLLSKEIAHPNAAATLTGLLEDVQNFAPPGLDVQTLYTIHTELVVELLVLLNQGSLEKSAPLVSGLTAWLDGHPHSPLVLPVLTAACRSLASVRHMAELVETSIAAHFAGIQAAQGSEAWAPVLSALHMPELTLKAFVDECMSLGAFLTLHAHLLQLQHRNETLVYEMQLLLQVVGWIARAVPKTMSQEPKLLLWWHKALELLLLQLQHNKKLPLGEMARVLRSLVSSLTQLAEERVMSGLLGVLGLGHKSPLSPRFRLAARSMAVFLQAQLVDEHTLRLQPSSLLQLTPRAAQALSSLEVLGLNKQYVEFQGEIQGVCQFTREHQHCLHDANRLLATLATALFPSVRYLDIIRS
ncbi:ectopic P granules protein 5 homolog isoform X2 [Lampetra fluviatilis]